MDLDPEVYEPIILIEQAKWAGIPFTALLELPTYWRSWIAIGHAASSKAHAQANSA